ncbi:MAG: hypothetical protein IT443_13625 [Phycisphaeraceae bacterium]|nr:hypothetical protein [Phycisphaeraceae bacterium]
MPNSPKASNSPTPIGLALPPGRIDFHSHLLPGVDDGCQDFDQSLACVRLLRQNGYVATICTPHMAGHDDAPQNTPTHVQMWVADLQDQLRQAGEDYPLWAGGELRIREGVIDWLSRHGVPTLAGSRCVLTDMWESRWPKWAKPAYQWLLDQGYQPILAHPERLNCPDELDENLRELEAMGVWLQGNANCFTGAEGYVADVFVRQLLAEDRYRFLALDTHLPDSLPGRFEGLAMAEREYGLPKINALTATAPRRDFLGL